MGTNFYACRVRTNVEHEAIQKACVEHQYEKVKELINDSEKRYHIGKRSVGWQFLFCANDPNLAPWEPTRKSLDEFICRNDIRIEDEYGKVFTPEDFWKEIEAWLYHDPIRYINGADYDKLEPNKYYKPADMEYTTDEGLRWSRSADFS